jgi:glutamyl-tRNA synthetase
MTNCLVNEGISLEKLMTVKTRFAPSPTGLLHVGGVRTALFSWLFAKHHGGEFVLRIEDTDRERSSNESVEAIIKGMEWLNLSYDEGPYFQTERYERYHQIIQRLLKEGQAYRCDCSIERLENLRQSQMANKLKPRYDGHCREKIIEKDCKHVIRFKNPVHGEVVFTDKVYGQIIIKNSELDDLIIQRSDGNPTYNLTVVVDDWDMGITHVVRGDDHINNTPRQINLLTALGADIPIYAHLPMILGEDGKRLSKRHGAVSVLQFKEEGLLPHALLNYLVRLGWSYGDQELFSLKEMIGLFDLSNVSRGASSFNHDKLYWINQHYQKVAPKSEVAEALAWQFKQLHIDISCGPDLHTLIELQAERCKTLKEMVEKSLYFYQAEINYDEKAVKKHLRPVILEPLIMAQEKFMALANWSHEAMHQVIIEVIEHFELKMPKLAQPLRVAVTGTPMSPPIDTTLFLIGREGVLQRIEKAINLIKKRSETT